MKTTTFELEAEVEPGRWQVLRRDVASEVDAKRHADALREDYEGRGYERKVRVVKVTREFVA